MSIGIAIREMDSPNNQAVLYHYLCIECGFKISISKGTICWEDNEAQGESAYESQKCTFEGA